MANVNRNKFSRIKVLIPPSPMLDKFNSFVVRSGLKNLLAKVE